MPCALVHVLLLLGAATAMLPHSGVPAPASLRPSGSQLQSPDSTSAATTATVPSLAAAGALALPIVPAILAPAPVAPVVPPVVTAEVLRRATGNATALCRLLNPETVFAERSLVSATATLYSGAVVCITHCPLALSFL